MLLFFFLVEWLPLTCVSNQIISTCGSVTEERVPRLNLKESLSSSDHRCEGPSRCLSLIYLFGWSIICVPFSSSHFAVIAISVCRLVQNLYSFYISPTRELSCRSHFFLLLSLSCFSTPSRRTSANISMLELDSLVSFVLNYIFFYIISIINRDVNYI